MDIALVATGSPENDTFPVPKYGTSIQIWGLAQEFLAKGHEVTVFSSTYGEPSSRREHGIEIRELQRSKVDATVNGMFTKLIFSKRLSNVLQEKQPDIVFLRERYTSIFPVRLGIPCVYTVISPDAMDFFYEFSVSNHQLNRILFRYKQAIEYHACRNSNANIVMNQRVRDYLGERGMGPNHLIPIGIRSADFDRNGDIDRENHILYIGRFDENKRPEWVVEAHSNIQTDFELHLVGSGKTEEYVKRRARRTNGDVTFHGRVSRNRVIELMENSAIVVLPSKYDNSPNVVLEGMAAGCAVLASNSSGAAYMIDHTENGLLFDKHSSDDLIEKLDYLISNQELRRRLGQNAQRYAFDHHNMERIAEQYLQISEQLID